MDGAVVPKPTLPADGTVFGVCPNKCPKDKKPVERMNKNFFIVLYFTFALLKKKKKDKFQIFYKVFVKNRYKYLYVIFKFYYLAKERFFLYFVFFG
ncbi:MAG: hypothetical protein Kow0079_17020 [Vicingaceae bacterium]